MRRRMWNLVSSRQSHWLVCMVLLFGLVASGCAVVEGSGTPLTLSQDVGAFSKIVVRSSFQVTIKRGNQRDVSLTIDHNLRAFLDIHVEGDTLHLGLAQGVIYKDIQAHATITMPSLASLRLRGASQVTLDGVPCEEAMEVRLSGASKLQWQGAITLSSLEITASGASNVSMAGITVKGTTDIELSGASEATLEGTGQDLNLEVSGASRASLIDFALDRAEVDLSGASAAELQVVKHIQGQLSGASRLRYLGNPTRELTFSGASTAVPYLDDGT